MRSTYFEGNKQIRKFLRHSYIAHCSKITYYSIYIILKGVKYTILVSVMDPFHYRLPDPDPAL